VAEARRYGMGRAALGASVGTMIARILGFVRNIALTAAIGTGLVADSFNVADNLPNTLFLLLGGGTIAAVFVPQLVRHARVSDHKVEEYGTVLIAVSIIAGALVTVLSIVLGPLLIGALGGNAWSDAQSGVALAFLVWCAPQIFFLAVYWVVAQILNARGKFSSVSWLPATSSIVVLIGCIMVLTLGGVAADDLDAVTPMMVAALGGTTTLGAAVQTAALLIVLRRQGFRFRWPDGLRGLGLRTTTKTGLFAALATAAYQLSNVVVVGVTTQAGTAAQRLDSPGRGYTAYFYSQALIGVVSAIAVASLVTVLLQRLSRHYAVGDHDAANADLDTAALRIAAVTIPVTGIFLCLGPAIAEILFTRGSTDAAAAQIIGFALALSGLSLFPNALHKVMLRLFFAQSDGFRPFLSALVIGVVNVGIVLLAAVFIAPQYVIFVAAAGYSLSFIVEMPLKARRLRLRGFRLRKLTVVSIVRISAASLGSAIVIAASYLLLRDILFDSAVALWAYTALATTAFLGLYMLATRRSPASLIELVRWLRK